MLWGEDISTQSVITSLVNDCCQFYTAILGPPPPKDFAVSSKEDLELLPWLPPKHQFTNLDLQNYIHQWNLVLQSDHGHAASLKGGLAVMIMSHTLTETAIMEKILAGPSADVFHKGICLQGKGDIAYYDDQMSFEDEIILCGLYQVDIHKSNISTITNF